jgi:hypothetical protein
MRIIIALVFLGFCAFHLNKGYQRARQESPQLVDPRLASSVARWRHDMERTPLIWQARFARVKSIEVEPLPDGRAGCYDQWNRTVLVSQERLAAGAYSTRATVYHELGHGVLLLGHSSCKLMGPTKSEEYYRAHWGELVSEYIIAADNNKHNFTP